MLKLKQKWTLRIFRSACDGIIGEKSIYIYLICISLQCQCTCSKSLCYFLYIFNLSMLSLINRTKLIISRKTLKNTSMYLIILNTYFFTFCTINISQLKSCTRSRTIWAMMNSTFSAQKHSIHKQLPLLVDAYWNWRHVSTM
jgi:hypothetical protein